MTDTGFHKVLIVSEAPLGLVLTRMLQDRHVAADVVESYGRHAAMFAKLAEGEYPVVVLSNTTLTPKLMLEVIPEIQLRFPSVTILVLSACLESDFAASLERLRVHEVFKMLEDFEAAVERIAELVEGKKLMPRVI